jgi:hypothetical protein
MGNGDRQELPRSFLDVPLARLHRVYLTFWACRYCTCPATLAAELAGPHLMYLYA